MGADEYERYRQRHGRSSLASQAAGCSVVLDSLLNAVLKLFSCTAAAKTIIS